MPKCELCDKKVKQLFTLKYNQDEWLNVCSDCLGEGEVRAEAQYDKELECYLDDPDHERDIEIEER